MMLFVAKGGDRNYQYPELGRLAREMLGGYELMEQWASISQILTSKGRYRA
jgi:hypothetical protein